MSFKCEGISRVSHDASQAMGRLAISLPRQETQRGRLGVCLLVEG